METPVRLRRARTGLAVWLALAALTLPIPARSSTQSDAPDRPAATQGSERESWIRSLERAAESPDVEVARSARAALESLGRGDGRGGRDDREARGSDRRGPDERGREDRADVGRRRDERGELSPRDRDPRDRDGRGPSSGIDGRDGAGPRDGPPPGERPLRCGPGCCLHGVGARGGDRPPFPPPGPRGFPPPPEGRERREGPPPRDGERRGDPLPRDGEHRDGLVPRDGERREGPPPRDGERRGPFGPHRRDLGDPPPPPHPDRNEPGSEPRPIPKET